MNADRVIRWAFYAGLVLAPIAAGVTVADAVSAGAPTDVSRVAMTGCGAVLFGSAWAFCLRGAFLYARARRWWACLEWLVIASGIVAPLGGAAILGVWREHANAGPLVTAAVLSAIALAFVPERVRDYTRD